jgi:hypothetical protein
LKTSQPPQLCGADLGVRYNDTFAAHKSIDIAHNVLGCTLTCWPYVTMSQYKISAGARHSALLAFTIGVSERELKWRPLAPYAS